MLLCINILKSFQVKFCTGFCYLCLYSYVGIFEMHFWLQILIGDSRTKIHSRNILVAYNDVVTVIIDFVLLD